MITTDLGGGGGCSRKKRALWEQTRTATRTGAPSVHRRWRESSARVRVLWLGGAAFYIIRACRVGAAAALVCAACRVCPKVRCHALPPPLPSARPPISPPRRRRCRRRDRDGGDFDFDFDDDDSTSECGSFSAGDCGEFACGVGKVPPCFISGGRRKRKCLDALASGRHRAAW